jgi:hypothetical protein
MAACKLGVVELLELLRKPLSPRCRDEYLFYLGSILAKSAHKLRAGEVGRIAQRHYYQQIVSFFIVYLRSRGK